MAQLISECEANFRLTFAEQGSRGFADKLLFMPDLFNYLLTGVKSTEFTIASTSQLLNARTREWSWGIFEKFGFDKNLFTDILPAGKIIGKIKEDISEELGVPNIPVVAVASHDTGSAVASVPFDNSEESAYISCGTWSLMGMELQAPNTSEKAAEYNFTNEGGVENTTRFLKNTKRLKRQPMRRSAEPPRNPSMACPFWTDCRNRTLKSISMDILHFSMRAF